MELVPPGKPPANIRKAIVAKRRLEVSRLILRGFSIASIAAELHNTVATISKDKRILNELWDKETKGNGELHRARILREIGEQKRETWAGLERSKAEKKRTKLSHAPSTDKATAGQMVPTGVEHIREESVVDPRFLQVLQRLSALEAKLLRLTTEPETLTAQPSTQVNVLIVDEAGLSASLPWLSNIPLGRAEHGQPLLPPGEKVEG